MSLIPLVIIIALIVGAGYFLMEGEIKLPNFNRGPQVRRLEGFPTVVYTEEQLEKQRRVITNEQELGEFLNSVDKSGLLTVKEKIDFSKEYLLAVASKTYDETDHRIKIRKVYEDKDNKTLLVSVLEVDPGETCADKVELDKNVALEIAAISKTDWKIEFERMKQVEECN